MKIFYTGDVHLDSPFKNIDPVRAEERRREIRKTFSDMMEYCAENRVDLVLITGDLFDNEFVTRETVALLRKCFSKLQCPVVIAPGNHDPAEDGSIWKREELFPQNVCIFTDPSLSYFSFDDIGVDVYGWAFTSRFMQNCPLENMHPERPDRINILAAHGDTTSPISASCPLPPAALKSFGADWCALGHIHNTEAANEALSGFGAYCGCPEGRDFGECGTKSAVLLTVEKTNGKAEVSAERICFAKRKYCRIRVQCDGAADMSDIISRVDAAVESENIESSSLLRIVLCGSVPPSLSVNTKAVADSVDSFYYVEVEDETSPTWDAAYLMSDKGIRGEVYRQLLPMLESSDKDERECGNRALRFALAALDGEEIAAL